MFLALTQSGGPALAAFLAALVEFIEALTIVLAVGVVRGWRNALTGAGLGFLLLAALILAFGPALTHIPLGVLQIVIGALLLLFGLRWLRKAMLRAAGVIPLHDEAQAFEKETRKLSASGALPARYDAVAVMTSFKAVVLEGVEVVFIVVAVSVHGAGFAPAIAGAGLALLVVVALGVALRRPLEKIPENALKFAVGVLIAAFGLFWLGEGLGADWPAGDASLPALILGMLAVGLAGAAGARRLARAAR